MGEDRLFVPLTAEAWHWWQQGKRWEVRKWLPRWEGLHTRVGRRVELRCGYSGPSLWGTIKERRFGALHDAVLGIPAAELAPPHAGLHPTRFLPFLARAIGATTENPDVVAIRIELDGSEVKR